MLNTIDTIRSIRKEDQAPEGFPELDLTIGELPDFKSVTDFDEDSELIAVVSHPGWKSHRSSLDEKYEKLKKYWVEEIKREVYGEGLFRSRVLTLHDSAHPEVFLDVRQMILEEELFRFLAASNTPTIVTVPVVQYTGDVEESEDLVERMHSIIASQRFALSKVMSKSFPNYLRDIRFGRENFYLAITESEDEDEGKDQARGDLLGDYKYRGLERDGVAHFLEALNGKKVLFAGSSIQGCLDTTLGYSKFVNAKVLVMLNYCGLNRPASVSLVDSEEYERNGQNLEDFARNHPQIKSIMKKVANLFDGSLEDIEERTTNNFLYETSQDSRIFPCDKYVSELS